MTLRQQAVRFGAKKLTSRVSRALPWVGTAVALLTLGATIRRKGLVGGCVDCTLNAVPVVGTMKIVAETLRGKDFIPVRNYEGRVTT
jgi:hypothetical protein